MPRILEKPLEDWRVGDIALCPDGVERTIHERNDTGCYWVLSEEGMASCWKQTDMMEMQRPFQNPVFRAGDMVRGRNPHVRGKWRWFQMDVALTNPDRFALVERAPVAERKELLTPPVRVNVLRCLLCKHPQPHGENAHYASCFKNPELKGTRIRHLGWDQPPPITVLCQNDEDVP